MKPTSKARLARTRVCSRRRPRAVLALHSQPAGLSPVMGNGAMAALVLLVTWVMFMMLVYPAHAPEVSEDQELALFETMFSSWAWAALLAMAFLIVDTACRTAVGAESLVQRLVVDLLAMVLLTMMMATNIQFSRVYGEHHWERTSPYLSTYEVMGEYPRESFLLPVTTNETRWDDYLSWVTWEAQFGTRTIRLEFAPGQTVRSLSQCTTPAWGSGITELRIRVGAGDDHRLIKAWDGLFVWDLLVPKQDGGIGMNRLSWDLNYKRYQDQIAPSEVVDIESWLDPMSEDELDRLLKDSARHRPVSILVSRDASMEWLDALLDQLEERGAEYFTLVFHG